MQAKPIRIPLIDPMNTRGINAGTNFTTLDAIAQNCIFIPVKDEAQQRTRIYVEKRPGFAAGSTISVLNTLIFTYWWAGKSSGTGVVVNTGLDGSLNAVVATGNSVIKTHANSDTVRYITETVNSSGTAFLTWTRPQSNEVWGYDDGGSTAQITVNSGFTGRLEHMDGWSFGGMKFPARIYNSNLNDPTTGYTNYISCDTETDYLLTVLKYGRYILGMGRTSIEWFANVGNSSGSPLARIQDPALIARYSKIGLYSPSASVTADAACVGAGSVWFLSEGSDSGISLYQITGMELKKISDATLDRIFTQTGPSVLKYVEWAGIPMVWVCFSSTVLVYFPQVGLWSYWTTANSINFQTIVNDATPEGSSLRCYKGTTIAQLSASSPVYQDNGSNITRLIRTNVFDFGNSNRKFETDFRIIGDRQTSTANISVRRTNDDYATWDTARDIDMSQPRPHQVRNGSFYRRAYELSDTTNGAGRIEAIEPWIAEGVL